MRNSVAQLTFISFFALAISGCSRSEPESVSTAVPVNFTTVIKPLFEANCLPCHHSGTLIGGLSLETRTGAFRQSDRGIYIVPGKPDDSLIYTMTRQRHGKQDEVMPADGILLSDEQREILRRWIEEGADWPQGKEGVLKPLDIQPGEA